MWLLPTERFKRESHRHRGKSNWSHLVSDVDQAKKNHIARDLILAQMYRDDVTTQHLPWIEVDVGQDAAFLATNLGKRFAHHLDDTYWQTSE